MRNRIAGDIRIINDAFNNVEDHSEERANRDAQNNLANQLREFNLASKEINSLDVKKHKSEDRLSYNYILKFDDLWLDIKSGRAGFKDKNHRFDQSGTPFIVLKLLLERKNDPTSKDGEVIRQEFMEATGLKSWETIRQRIRDTRRHLGISRKENPNLDPFQDTGNGYRLIEPLEDLIHS